MLHSSTNTLINPQNGNLAFKVFSFEDNGHFDHLQRNNYYAVIWVMEGSGTVKADFSAYAFEPNVLFAFSPYQPFMFSADADIKGIALYFHPDFFCIHKHHKEVACAGVLFNNIYQPPYTKMDERPEIRFASYWNRSEPKCKILPWRSTNYWCLTLKSC